MGRLVSLMLLGFALIVAACHTGTTPVSTSPLAITVVFEPGMSHVETTVVLLDGDTVVAALAVGRLPSPCDPALAPALDPAVRVPGTLLAFGCAADRALDESATAVVVRVVRRGTALVAEWASVSGAVAPYTEVGALDASARPFVVLDDPGRAATTADALARFARARPDGVVRNCHAFPPSCS